MQVPLSFLKEYIDIDLSTKEIAKIFTDAGIEVEAIDHETPPFSGVVSAEVVSVQPHPQADRLMVAEVTDGEQNFTVVCGAPNCRAGLRVALAKVGANLSTQEKKFSIKQTKIRGIESQGMLCSQEELGLAKDSEGILELEQTFPLGKDLAALYFEPIFHFSLTPNLSRCLGVIGLARELAAMTGKKVHLPELSFQESTKEKIDSYIKVQKVDFDLCSRYMCRVVKLPKNIETPIWLKKRLEDCNIKPIHVVVDILNYVMLELNQPMHAFDLEKIDHKTIEVRKLLESETFFGLDSVERVLPKDAIVVADPKKILALAGILGGFSSAVDGHTHTFLLESAQFSYMPIRKASKKIQLSTESSTRFEKETDPNTCEVALNRACHLLQKICQAEIVKGYQDVLKKKILPLHITLRVPRANKILGTHLSQSEMEQILQRLECEVQSKKEGCLDITIPSYRTDIKQEIDLIEEIARIYGYNNIEKPRPLCTNSPYVDHPMYLFEQRIKELCLFQRLQEVVSSSLISPKLKEILHGFSSDFFIPVLHSKSSEHSILRPSHLSSFLSIIRHNQDQKTSDLGFFETSRVHMQKDGNFLEIPMLACALVGNSSLWNWSPTKPKENSFFDMKELFENLFHELKIFPIIFTPSMYPNFHPSRQAQIFYQDAELGVLGEIHPATLKTFDIKQRVFFGEINLQLLFQITPKTVKSSPLPIYPSSERDWTFAIKSHMEVGPLLTSIRSIASTFLENVFLHDLYINPSYPDEKQVTLRFIYRDSKKTISHDEVEQEYAKILKEFQEKYLKIEG